MSQSNLQETSLPNESECATISSVLSRVGDKWTIQTIVLLDKNKKRFSELKKGIPNISQKMLTTTLRALERDGLVKRTVYPTVPVKVEYELTALGRSLWTVVDALGQWVINHVVDITQARQVFDHAQKKDPEPLPSIDYELIKKSSE